MLQNIYMRSSNCWHWKLLSNDLNGSACVPFGPPNNWFVAFPVPVKLQPLPVNDCTCVSLFVSRILSFEKVSISNTHTSVDTHAHVHRNTNHLRKLCVHTHSHNSTNVFFLSNDFNDNQYRNSSWMVFFSHSNLNVFRSCDMNYCTFRHTLTQCKR